ncbi:RNA-binding protein 34 [Gracilariopsis chorda]|uniref:RNA-binding protein 34 n=1 Tax=Gracilariopsis chorda TaxID=448386 RepID=A0A2V3J3E8_9FLOR|nr:RNA-binding protein 34 [Gracilariopsis chorda]|eukprot:PXF48642.1 RNA-binding protein 34 [Gracilariopsis chorda]
MTDEIGKRKRDPKEQTGAGNKTRPLKKKRKHGLHPLTEAERRELPHYASFEDRVLAEQRSELGTGGRTCDKDKEAEEEKETFKSRNSRTIFVGNVDMSASENDIARLFARFGEVEEVRIRGIVSNTRKRPKRKPAINNQTAEFLATGQAYVVFKNHERVYTCISEACKDMNMTVFKNKHIRVTPACETTVGPRRMSLFVGNLPFDCMEEELVEAFLPIAEESGVKLVGVRCNRDLDTGAGRGVGFVAFDDILGVQAARNKVGEIKIRGRVLRIDDASKKKDRRTKTFKRRTKPSRHGSNRRAKRR